MTHGSQHLRINLALISLSCRGLAREGVVVGHGVRVRRQPQLFHPQDEVGVDGARATEASTVEDS